ncbi:MAG TPA: SpaA isopeptide-forming pilin-related protein [Bacteroidia bacterium]|jgi:hypothetical protein|nr:SpaA isopeptide-forming pilin-related protein [Bacteroidia bacterium]
MKIFPIVALLSVLFCCCKSKSSNTQASGSGGTTTVLMSGTISIVSDYCGGAQPSEAMLHPAPVPTAGIKLYVKRGEMNSTTQIIDSVVSGENGIFQIDLQPGKYCFVESVKKDSYVSPKDDQFATWDTACYHQHYSECDYYVELTKDFSAANIILFRHCPWTTPCESYHGPLPPAAQHPHNE